MLNSISSNDYSLDYTQSWHSWNVISVNVGHTLSFHMLLTMRRIREVFMGRVKRRISVLSPKWFKNA